MLGLNNGSDCFPDAAISRNPIISAIAVIGAKQSFLLWDKVYQKITDEGEEKWLLRAIDACLQYFPTELSKSEALRYVVDYLS